MLTETGRVVALEDDSVWVETIRRSTCGTCAAEKACGHGLINKISDGQRGYVRVLPGEVNVAHCQIDDQVIISIPEEVILRGSFIAYLMPLVAMLAGAALAVQFGSGSQDVLAALGAAMGLAGGFGLVKWHGVANRQNPDFQPVLLEVLTPQAQAVSLI